MQTRYSYGGDEHIFVEVSEEMSLAAFFKSLSITQAIRNANLPGVEEICPANASFQVKYNPDICAPETMLAAIQDIEKAQASGKAEIDTRIVEVPVFYQDPWTHETLMRFRDRHQDPDGTDLSYAARINGYDSVDAFIEAHSGSPWFVTMVGFVSGLPFMFQMVEREKQIQVPKYVRPRTDTPKQTVGYGGCFSCIYSVRGAGGYQMFGVTPMPIYDPAQSAAHLKDFLVYFKPGDIVKFKPIPESEYHEIIKQVEDGTYQPRTKPVRFSLSEFEKDMAGYNAAMQEALYEH
ncbi:5-oxoprolinase subunit B family protein [Grimontia hollisae]|uniref:Sporulation inhibitor kipI n=1 Tax=Grimontia hollisae TaxID=673 RepID=A0A377J7H9_GRIHO|nr:allophanate hydrolase subunit 1 [Grimontia hollisae]MDF2184651.1 allophanate hydrolase subunit 1 [Grimontia hollisae]STO98452.1 Sporulation inhibitor kipI [Grimontia hollisae]STQ75720.1 Sporulation inhibitor kipI [Grimontia hollisae]